ncbi:glycosyltransferase family 4 protein [Ramlibacter albus]|uniref:Glycosyltransferase family 4 protein n=1 Tax=Ramlibacter albus TaxID=2079448 RepID=A0A923S3U3_9BURK|nr:glycosyltransferase family 4 protein [Ramlibacter albus]
MKVLYFHQHFVTPKGPGAVRSYMMARHLVEHGHSVTMVCGSAKGATTGLDGPFTRGMRQGMVDGIRVIELDLAYSNSDGFAKRSWTFIRFALRSILLALREPCDLVFATSTPLTAALPGIAARWLRGKPFVFEVRDLWPELPRAMGVIRNPVVLGAMGVLEYAGYRSASALVGLSPGIVEGIARRGTPPGRIHMVPNGCDLDIFAAETEPWRPEGVASGDLMCVFAGTHGIANGLDSVLDAAAVLQGRGRADIKLVLVGDGKLKPALVRRAAQERLDNVVFLAPVNKARLAGLLAGTDIGLQVLADVPAFYYGTSPNKFFDYLAAGLPVLTNYPGWVADLVQQHDCGWGVPARNPEAFADALEEAARHRERLPVMGANARTLARTQFSRRVLAARWTAAVLGVAAPHAQATTESPESR